MRAEINVVLHVKCPLFLSDLNQNYDVLNTLKRRNTKFHENVFSVSLVYTCRRIFFATFRYLRRKEEERR
jgi:hypothetical protein